MAQQVSTLVACRLAERARFAHPHLTTPSPANVPDAASLRAIGLSQRRAECCVEIVRRSEEILSKVRQGQSWEQALTGIKGIGPWTVSVFRIMVLREPDVLPLPGTSALSEPSKTSMGGLAALSALGKLGALSVPWRVGTCGELSGTSNLVETSMAKRFFLSTRKDRSAEADVLSASLKTHRVGTHVCLEG